MSSCDSWRLLSDLASEFGEQERGGRETERERERESEPGT